MKMAILILLLISNAMGAPTTNSDPYTIKQHHNFEITTNKINPSTAPLSDLIQLQTDAIKKILSTSLQTPNPDLPSPNNKCEDIETGIKESIRKSNAQHDIIINNIQKEQTTEIVTEEPIRGDSEDSVTEEVTVKSEKNSIPNGRTLFSLYRNDLGRSNENTTPNSPTSTFIPENQNIILVPCIKRVVQNGTKTQYEEVSDINSAYYQQYQQQQQQDPYALTKNYEPQETNDQLIHSIDSNKKYVLEKVYAPNGYLLYYMYRAKNLNPEQSRIDHTTPTSVSTSSTTTTTSTTTNSPLPDPMYKEQLKFVIQMPYAEPEQVQPYGYKFDQHAYYPSELQPSYVNGPVPYRPTYHMIRTLVIPNEYNNVNQNNGDYVLNNPQNNENK